MQVSGLSGAQCLCRFPQELRQPLHAGYPDDVNVIVTAERLDQGEVDLQGDVILLLFIYGEEAQDHAVRVPAGERGCQGEARHRGDGTVHELGDHRRERSDKTTVHQECARTSPPPSCTVAGEADYANADGSGGGGAGFKVNGVALSKQKPQNLKLAMSGFCSESPPPRKNLREMSPSTPQYREHWESPLRPVPYRGVGSARASEGRPHPRANKGGADSHIHQFGRLVHPHGEAILTLRGHQQLLHRGGHRLHPKRSRERRLLADDSRPTSGGGW